MKATIKSPDELTTIRIEGNAGTYKIFTSFRPTEAPAFVDAVEKNYRLVEIKNVAGGKGYFLIHCKKEKQENILEDLTAILYDNVRF